ncbi:hypothetical protein DPMN_187788 [Dreissena polymorpha]|uniref:Immunoglobulin I-set domain-containing protein n=1 Tax=Dreissena polymorpha TaxID=45954 RepID=A0A9D4DS86_DREPO|nr:hypothetical protein DPMN_187788 [Dreissena polymorpha]
MKDGRVISPGGRFHMSNEGGTCHLVIDDVMSQDAGVYTCIISNNQGKSSSTAALKLNGKLTLNWLFSAKMLFNSTPGNLKYTAKYPR